MQMVSINATDKGVSPVSKEEAELLRIIHKLGTKLAQSKHVGDALMLNGAIEIIAGAYISKNPNHISYAKSVASKAMSSW